MNRKNKLNRVAVGRIGNPLAEYIKVIEPRIESEVLTLSKLYREERQAMVDASEKHVQHQSLAIMYYREPVLDIPELIDIAGVYLPRMFWVRGKGKFNNPKARELSANKMPKTTKIHNCGRTGDYTKTNINQALRRAQPWERQLTWEYELLLQKMREFARHWSGIVEQVTYSPRFPRIPAGGPNGFILTDDAA